MYALSRFILNDLPSKANQQIILLIGLLTFLTNSFHS
jgi:hypothetical protein